MDPQIFLYLSMKSFPTSSLAYSEFNPHTSDFSYFNLGFITTPYRKVESSFPPSTIVVLLADLQNIILAK